MHGPLLSNAHVLRSALTRNRPAWSTPRVRPDPIISGKSNGLGLPCTGASPGITFTRTAALGPLEVLVRRKLEKWERLPVSYVPQASQKSAAIHLMVDFWRSRTADANLDH